METKEKVPDKVAGVKTKAKAGAKAKAVKHKTGPEPSILDKLPATFANWKDGESQIMANLDLHIFSLARQTDAMADKLTKIAEEEIVKAVLLLRKRIRAKSKKLDLGCRVM